MADVARWAAQAVEGDALAAAAFVRATQRPVVLAVPHVARLVTVRRYCRAPVPASGGEHAWGARTLTVAVRVDEFTATTASTTLPVR